jgi:hypothetical protein
MRFNAISNEAIRVYVIYLPKAVLCKPLLLKHFLAQLTLHYHFFVLILSDLPHFSSIS